ncbi:MAG: NADH-quinone oxidoreductase subunit C [Acidobacteria bacterium]|nr:NADH-quinone oxidoreductase subunit C [Acidobacteriota bacterium]
MTSEAIIEALRGAVPPDAVEPAPSADGMAAIYASAEHIVDVCRALRDTPSLRFAFAADMTAADYMPREPRFEVVLILASLGVAGFGETPKRLRVKVRLPGRDPRMRTLSEIWPAMNWAEREVWDLFGIVFDGHPNLHRLLMPDDWEGHPARKDYPVQIKLTPKIYEPLQLTPEEFAANVRADLRQAGQD